MDTITFEVGDIAIQLVNGQIMFCANGTDNTPDIEMPIAKLQSALSAANMLRKPEKKTMFPGGWIENQK